MPDNDYYEIEVQIVRHWDKAVLVNHGDGEDWIPYSQIAEDEDIVRQFEEGEFVSLEVKEWLLIEKGIF